VEEIKCFQEQGWKVTSEVKYSEENLKWGEDQLEVLKAG
jgi:hypothetical protein